MSGWLGYLAGRKLYDLAVHDGPSRKPGESYLLPDEQARQSACAQLAADPSRALGALEVRVLSGVLQLSGSVPTDSLKQRAEQLCATVAGVSRVENHITVP